MKVKAGIIPWKRTEKGIEMLFFRSSNAAYGGAKFQISKGHIDKGETSMAAGIREGKEELGIKEEDIASIELGGSFKFRGQVEDYRLDLFEAEMKEGDLGETDYESAEVRWMTPGEFEDEGRDDQRGLVRTVNKAVETRRGKSTKSDDWWGEMGRGEQKECIQNHPGTQKRISRIAKSVSKVKVIEFARMKYKNASIELFHVVRDGIHYLFSFGHQGPLSYGVEKGSQSTVKNLFQTTQDKIVRGVELYHKPHTIETTRLDSEARKHLRILDIEGGVFGIEWDKVDEAKEISDAEDFNELLSSQLKNWKGSYNSLEATRHKYWDEFRAMVTKAVKKKYGNRIKLYRGIHGDQAKEILRGGPIKVRKFSSWTISKEAAKSYRGYRGDYWVVVSIEVPASKIALAPVHLPDHVEPDVLMGLAWDVQHVGDELVLESNGAIRNYKSVLKTRKKR